MTSSEIEARNLMIKGAELDRIGDTQGALKLCNDTVDKYKKKAAFAYSMIQTHTMLHPGYDISPLIKEIDSCIEFFNWLVVNEGLSTMKHNLDVVLSFKNNNNL